MKRNLLLAAMACVGLSAIHPAQAEDLTGTLKKIKETNTITIGYRESSVPFSYLDDKQKPIGYALDLCYKVVDAVKAKLNLPNLKVGMQPVTSANRIPLMQNGTIDMECGSTTNSVKRQEQVSFGDNYFVTSVKVVVKKNSGINSLSDLNGQPIATTSGTTSVQLIKENEKGSKIDFKTIYGKDHAESFLLVANDRAKAFVMDDILIAGLVANSKDPQDYKFLPEVLHTEPYAIMLRKDDPEFKKVVDDTMVKVMKSGEAEKLYNKWFMSPIPPKGVNLNFPMSPELKEAFAHPTDAGSK
ncbi:MAG TPA: transporter substrate-binding domain-containing protein [Limnobacter sp.]|uniref:transporter substrate-binding domain-containing protein n=1 Tax=Limnobacter sp. TaxID=2003368 RepID=UPI002E3104CB|nr:transporter substrate-binding domain-containing protein [Limnobacter sp.]HEX5485631.1 transporter substrate-binding domain-containing protein [Limnobacter sp.]